MTLRKIISYIDFLNTRWIKIMYAKHKIDDFSFTLTNNRSVSKSILNKFYSSFVSPQIVRNNSESCAVPDITITKS